MLGLDGARKFRTGSTLFFGTGRDKDMVVLLDQNIQDYCDAQGYSVHKLSYPGQFACIKEGDKDYIIVKTEEDFYRWRHATRCFMRLVKDSPKTATLLQADKQARVAVFEAFAANYEHE